MKVIKFAPGLIPVLKHQEHDQSSHGNWAKGGNGLGIEAVQALHKSSDPLKERVYEAERSIAKTSVNTLEKPTAPKLSDFPSRGDYDKAYKEYSKKWMKWAVEERASVLSELGEKLLDGTPSGIKKYVNEGGYFSATINLENVSNINILTK